MGTQINKKTHKIPARTSDREHEELEEELDEEAGTGAAGAAGGAEAWRRPPPPAPSCPP